MEIIRLNKWQTPASRYPRKQTGKACIRTSYYKPAFYHCYRQRGYDFFKADRRLYVTTLQIDDKTWMVDDPPHWWGMEEHAKHYHGHVLCAGLGLGLIVHALTDNPSVERITVIEREKDVIDLVGPLVPQEKLQVIHGDFHEITPDDLDAQPDGVLYDLFVGNGFDLIETACEMASKLDEMWANGSDYPIRIHGFPPKMIQRARTR